MVDDAELVEALRRGDETAFRRVVTTYHVGLVRTARCFVHTEALAEEVAQYVLKDPRVSRVTVRVEKLELGPGGVGVEIERRRVEEHAAAASPPLPTAPDVGRRGGKGARR